MNFSEKLTNLRKQKGLSQEELGFELNVTRQTISKWELGQTTPEMEKLVEMSKIFGISLDELTGEGEITNNETQKIEDKAINDKPKSNSTLKVILLIVAIFIIGGILIYTFIFSKILNFGRDIFDEGRKIREQATGIINTISEEVEQQIENNEKREELNQEKENIKTNEEQTTEKQSSNYESINEQAEQIRQQVNEQMENAKEQMTAEQREMFEQAQQMQQQMLQQYQ